MDGSRILIVYVFCSAIFFPIPVVSILVLVPTDIFAVRGSTVTLPCHTNLSAPVSWEVERTGGGVNWEHFYKGYGDIPDIYQYKYNVSADSARGQYNLTIRDVQPDDSGTYRCGDNFGLGLKNYKEGMPGNGATAELIVIDDTLICWKEIPERHLNQLPFSEDSMDEIKMKCKTTYRGNIPPNLHWRVLNSEEDDIGISLKPSALSDVTNEGPNTVLTSEIFMNSVKVIHKSYIKCEILGLYVNSPKPSRNSTVSEISWSSNKIEIAYTAKTETAFSPSVVVAILCVFGGIILAALITVGAYVLLMKKLGYRIKELKTLHRDLQKLSRKRTKAAHPDPKLSNLSQKNSEQEKFEDSNLLQSAANEYQDNQDYIKNHESDSGIEERQLRSFNTVIQEIQELLSRLELILKSIKKGLRNKKESFKENNPKFKSLKRSSQKVNEQAYTNAYINSVVTDLHEAEEHAEILLSLLAQRKGGHATQHSFRNDILPSGTIKHKNPIRGISVIKNKVFVVGECESSISVYDSENFWKFSREISISGMKKPEGLASCEQNTSLYVIDSELKCIHRAYYTENATSSEIWNLDDTPLGLSMTEDQTLLVTLRINRRGGDTCNDGESRVVEFTSEGVPVNEKKLDGKFRHALVTISVSSNQFLVFDGSYLNEVPIDDNIECTEPRKFFTGNKKSPHYAALAVGNYANCIHIFVSDYWNKGVLLLNSNLEYVKELKAQHELTLPTRLYFDSNMNRLYVGGNNKVITIINIPVSDELGRQRSIPNLRQL